MEFAITARKRLITPTKLQLWSRFTMRTLVDWKAYAWISVGAVVGANLRYFLATLIARLSTTAFPIGTLIINTAGSLILGFFVVWTTERVLADPLWRSLVAVGFCGSYTTFSSYAFETIAYFEQGNWLLFAGNILSNNILCLGAVLAGGMLARAL